MFRALISTTYFKVIEIGEILAIPNICIQPSISSTSKELQEVYIRYEYRSIYAIYMRHLSKLTINKNRNISVTAMTPYITYTHLHKWIVNARWRLMIYIYDSCYCQFSIVRDKCISFTTIEQSHRWFFVAKHLL